jgi:hypothetical protein
MYVQHAAQVSGAEVPALTHHRARKDLRGAKNIGGTACVSLSLTGIFKAGTPCPNT